MYRQLRPLTVRTYRDSEDPASAERGLVIARIYFFCYYGAIGTLAPFLNVYLEQIGLSGVQIGWLGSIPPLIALFANPFWGAIADRWQIHRFVLALLALVGGLTSLLYLTSTLFWPLLGFTILMTFFRRPIGSIIDGTAVELVKQTGHTYGRQRMWGSVGFVLTSYGLGLVLSGGSLTLAFWIHTLLMGGICTALSFMLPIAAAKEPVNIVAGLRQLAGQASYRGFLTAVTFFGMGMSGYLAFLSLYMIDLGGSASDLGILWVAVAIMEVPVMYFGARSFERFGYRRILQWSFFGFILGWGLMGFATSPLFLILNVLLISTSFACYWVSVVNYASETAPTGMSATAQALVGAMQSGLGWSIGSVIAGYLWDLSGPQAVYAFSTGAVIIAAASFWWGNRPTET